MRFYWGVHNHPTVRGHSTHIHTHRLIRKCPQVTDERSTADDCERVRAISMHVHNHTTGSDDRITPGKWDSTKTVTGGSVSIRESLAWAFSFTHLTAHLRGRLLNSEQASRRTDTGPKRIQLLSNMEENREKFGFFWSKSFVYQDFLKNFNISLAFFFQGL